MVFRRPFRSLGSSATIIVGLAAVIGFFFVIAPSSV
jgi:hypothetical protein